MLHHSSSLPVVGVIDIGTDYELREALWRAANRLRAMLVDPRYDTSSPAWRLVVAIELVVEKGNPSFEDYCRAFSSLARAATYQELIEDPQFRDSWNEVCVAVIGWSPIHPQEITFRIDDFIRPI